MHVGRGSAQEAIRPKSQLAETTAKFDGPSSAALAYIVTFADADRALAAVSAKVGQPEDEVQ